eukprot:gene3853-2731_t
MQHVSRAHENCHMLKKLCSLSLSHVFSVWLYIYIYIYIYSPPFYVPSVGEKRKRQLSLHVTVKGSGGSLRGGECAIFCRGQHTNAPVFTHLRKPLDPSYYFRDRTAFIIMSAIVVVAPCSAVQTGGSNCEKETAGAAAASSGRDTVTCTARLEEEDLFRRSSSARTVAPHETPEIAAASPLVGPSSPCPPAERVEGAGEGARAALAMAHVKIERLQNELLELEGHHHAAQQQVARQRQAALNAGMEAVTLRAERDELVAKLNEAYERLAMLSKAFEASKGLPCPAPETLRVALPEPLLLDGAAQSVGRAVTLDNAENGAGSLCSVQAILTDLTQLWWGIVKSIGNTKPRRDREDSSAVTPSHLVEQWENAADALAAWAEAADEDPSTAPTGVPKCSPAELIPASLVVTITSLRSSTAALARVFQQLARDTASAVSHSRTDADEGVAGVTAPHLATIAAMLQCEEEWDVVKEKLQQRLLAPSPNVSSCAQNDDSVDYQRASLAAEVGEEGSHCGASFMRVGPAGLWETPPRPEKWARAPTLPRDTTSSPETTAPGAVASASMVRDYGEALLLMGRAYSGITRDMQDLLAQREYSITAATSLSKSYQTLLPTSPLLFWRVHVIAIIAAGRLQRWMQPGVRECIRVPLQGLIPSAVPRDTVRLRLPVGSRVALEPASVRHSTAPASSSFSLRQVSSTALCKAVSAALRSSSHGAAPPVTRGFSAHSQMGDRGPWSAHAGEEMEMEVGKKIFRLLFGMQQLLEDPQANALPTGASLVQRLGEGLKRALWIASAHAQRRGSPSSMGRRSQEDASARTPTQKFIPPPHFLGISPGLSSQEGEGGRQSYHNNAAHGREDDAVSWRPGGDAVREDPQQRERPISPEGRYQHSTGVAGSVSSIPSLVSYPAYPQRRPSRGSAISFMPGEGHHHGSASSTLTSSPYTAAARSRGANQSKTHLSSTMHNTTGSHMMLSADEQSKELGREGSRSADTEGGQRRPPLMQEDVVVRGVAPVSPIGDEGLSDIFAEEVLRVIHALDDRGSVVPVYLGHGRISPRLTDGGFIPHPFFLPSLRGDGKQQKNKKKTKIIIILVYFCSDFQCDDGAALVRPACGSSSDVKYYHLAVSLIILVGLFPPCATGQQRRRKRWDSVDHHAHAGAVEVPSFHLDDFLDAFFHSMRGLSTLYLCACEREGCLSNSKLVQFFAELDQYSPTDTLTDERQKRNMLGQEMDLSMEHGEVSLQSRACPSVLDFTQNYLGDAGLAAVFRVLPLMRWVKKVLAQGCGAGPQSVKALCDVLTMELPTVYDTTRSSTIGLPLIALECVDLRGNAIFVASGRQLLKALDARRRVTARYDVDLPPMEVLVDYHNLPYSISSALEALNLIGYEDRKRRQVLRKRQEESEQQRLFCVDASAMGGTIGTVSSLQPTGENVIYRIPEYMPNDSKAPDAAPLLFYNSADPRLARLVREMNHHMEDYLVAFKCLSKRVTLEDGTGAGEFLHARAAAQICVELGADTLSFLPFTNASVWFEDSIRREDPATAAILAEEETMRKTASSGRTLSCVPSMGDIRHIHSITAPMPDGQVATLERERRKKAEERKVELELRYAEINMNVSSLLRGFYANPHLEMEVAEHRGPTLMHYMHRLRELFYDHGCPDDDPLAEADRMQLLEALYNRVVTALTSKSMTDLPSMRQFEERLSDIRLYMVEEMLMGTAVEDLMRLQRAIRNELIPPVPYETAKWIVDARSTNLPPPREWATPSEGGGDKPREEEEAPAEVAGGGAAAASAIAQHRASSACSPSCANAASPYRRVWPLWCTQMKYFLFNNMPHQREWNKELVPKERRRWTVFPPQVRTARKLTGTLGSVTSPTPLRFSESRGQTPYMFRDSVDASLTKERQTPQRQTEAVVVVEGEDHPHAVAHASSRASPWDQSQQHQQLQDAHNEEDDGNDGDDTREDDDAEEAFRITRRTSKKALRDSSDEEDEEEFCYEEEEGEEDDDEASVGPKENPVPLVYRSEVLCTCQQRLQDSFPVRPPTSARRTCLPRPCPSCCYSALAILPSFFSDTLMLERLELQEKVRDALPMELKVFFLDMILRRRSRSAYVPRMFGIGTRLRKEEDGGLLAAATTASGSAAGSEGSAFTGFSILPDRHAMQHATATGVPPELPNIPSRRLVSIMDFFAAVDGKRERMLEVLSGFEEWYRLKMVESFDVAYPYLARGGGVVEGIEDDDGKKKARSLDIELLSIIPLAYGFKRTPLMWCLSSCKSISPMCMLCSLTHTLMLLCWFRLLLFGNGHNAITIKYNFSQLPNEQKLRLTCRFFHKTRRGRGENTLRAMVKWFPLGGGSSESVAASPAEAETREALQALFSPAPKHVGLDSTIPVRSPSSCNTAQFGSAGEWRVQEGGSTPNKRAYWKFWEWNKNGEEAAAPSVESHWAPVKESVRLMSVYEQNPHAVSGLSNASSSVKSWRDLPPCPVEGFRLTEKGLVDEHYAETGIIKEAASGRRGKKEEILVSPAAMRDLLREFQSLEQSMKYTVDEQLPSHVRSRSLRGLEMAVNPCLLLTGLYLMSWKTAQLYRCAVPRHSVVLTKLMALTRWHLSAREKEEMAQQHRRLLRATNARVSLTFSTGVALTAFAWWTRPRIATVDDSPEVKLNNEVIAYHNHTSAALKWMWYVYYHHPAYAQIVFVCYVLLSQQKDTPHMKERSTDFIWISNCLSFSSSFFNVSHTHTRQVTKKRHLCCPTAVFANALSIHSSIFTRPSLLEMLHFSSAYSRGSSSPTEEENRFYQKPTATADGGVGIGLYHSGDWEDVDVSDKDDARGSTCSSSDRDLDDVSHPSTLPTPPCVSTSPMVAQENSEKGEGAGASHDEYPSDPAPPRVSLVSGAVGCACEDCPASVAGSRVAVPHSVATVAAKSTEPYHILPADYSDRSRLLYHITHLATQLQRCQFQVQEQQRALVILNEHLAAVRSGGKEGVSDNIGHGEATEKREACTPILSLTVLASGFTAAVMAARDEESLQTAMEQRQHLFDPLLAQTQINRLDDALAHLSMLREAEVARAQRAEEELAALRESHQRAVEHVDALTTQSDQLQQRSSTQEMQLGKYALELERLRMEEARLNRQLVEVQRFAGASSGAGETLAVEGVMGSFSPSVLASHSCLRVFDQQVEDLLLQESIERERLWVTMFWEPMAMAIDAGITWLLDCERQTRERELEELRRVLDEEAIQRRKNYPTKVKAALDAGFPELVEKAALGDLYDAASPAVGSGATDTDLLLLRHQQEELQETRLKWEQAQHQLRRMELEVERLKALYQNEQRRSQEISADHAKQLKRVYQEVLKDRDAVRAAIQQDVERQVRAAYAEGRLYEQELQKQRDGRRTVNFGVMLMAFVEDKIKILAMSRPRSGGSQPPPPQRTPADVVAATFANLDLRAAKAALETYYQKYKDLEIENKMLREDLEQHEEDALKVVRHLEEELDKSVKETAKYKGEVDRIVADSKESSVALMEQYNEMLKERDKQISDYASVTERLQSDLRQASRYVQQRQEHVMELKHLHDQLEEMAAKHEKDLTALRFQTLDRKIKLVALEKTMRQGFKDMVEEESNRLLDLQHRTLLERNRVLEEEKVEMAHDIEDLMHLANNFTTEKAKMKRRAELHRKAHEEVLRHTVTSNRNTRDKEIKVQRLEAKVRELLMEKKMMRETIEGEYSARIAELEHKLKETNSALQLHRFELRQMRNLAKQVVQQRTDLENFFYVALQDCKRYRGQLNSASSMSFPEHSQRPMSSRSGVSSSKAVKVSPGPPADGVDFNASFSIQPPAHADTISRDKTMLSETISSRGTTKSSLRGVPRKGPVELPPVQSPGSGPGKHEAQKQLEGETFMTQTGLKAAVAAKPPPEPCAYIEELPWEDKEKIIKALLFYINSTYYKVQKICLSVLKLARATRGKNYSETAEPSWMECDI